MAKITGLGAMERDHVLGQRALDRDAENTSAPSIASSSVRRSVLTAWADFHWFMPSVAALVDHALGVAQDDVLVRNAHGLDQFDAGDGRRARAVADDLGVLMIFGRSDAAR
jgi:hypothetical protein